MLQCVTVHRCAISAIRILPTKRPLSSPLGLSASEMPSDTQWLYLCLISAPGETMPVSDGISVQDREDRFYEFDGAINRSRKLEEYVGRIVDHVRLVVTQLTLRWWVDQGGIRLCASGNPHTRLYGCGIVGQLPHWYRVPIIISDVAEISFLESTSGKTEQGKHYLCTRIAFHTVIQTTRGLHIA